MRLKRLISWMALGMCAGAWAGSPLPVEMRCAVGGEKFTYISTGAMTRWGSRPDGKPYGSWTFPMPLAECPDNGLVMYREFSKAEIKTLEDLLETAEYRQMRSTDTPYYRAYWLMRKLGDSPDLQLWVLQQASWESDMDLPRKQRYQQEFVHGFKGLARPEPPQDDLTWLITQLQAANALRELGKFDEAMDLLETIPRESLDVVVPEQHGQVTENQAQIRAAQSRRSWLAYAENLGKVIARGDSSSEPIDMVPVRVAAQMCEANPSTAPEFREVCESDEVKQQLEKSAKLRVPVTPPPPPANPPPADGAAPR